ncbi:hypothetical protein NPIL_315811 [Nephila pilipes]|uniref:Uncharacterized protein n=1 Tax=Nephila pilipes TaxID=299642 RepID=A0A8X6TBC5_NEPPI|nr:hypothetical protein NPIL_315811 [Nephila pilipes]
MVRCSPSHRVGFPHMLSHCRQHELYLNDDAKDSLCCGWDPRNILAGTHKKWISLVWFTKGKTVPSKRPTSSFTHTCPSPSEETIKKPLEFSLSKDVGKNFQSRVFFGCPKDSHRTDHEVYVKTSYTSVCISTRDCVSIP